MWARLKKSSMKSTPSDMTGMADTERRGVVCSHGIVSSSVGPEYYVGILSFVDKPQLEPGCSILMHNKVLPLLPLVHVLHQRVNPGAVSGWHFGGRNRSDGVCHESVTTSRSDFMHHSSRAISRWRRRRLSLMQTLADWRRRFKRLRSW